MGEVATRLGEGIGGLVNILDPAVVIAGGGVVAGAGDLVLDTARRAATATIEGGEHRPEVPIVPARLGADGAAIGAALWAREATA